MTVDVSDALALWPSHEEPDQFVPVDVDFMFVRNVCKASSEAGPNALTIECGTGDPDACVSLALCPT